MLLLQFDHFKVPFYVGQITIILQTISEYFTMNAYKTYICILEVIE